MHAAQRSSQRWCHFAQFTYAFTYNKHTESPRPPPEPQHLVTHNTINICFLTFAESKNNIPVLETGVKVTVTLCCCIPTPFVAQCRYYFPIKIQHQTPNPSLTSIGRVKGLHTGLRRPLGYYFGEGSGAPVGDGGQRERVLRVWT